MALGPRDVQEVDIGRPEASGGDVVVEQVREEGWSQDVESLASAEWNVGVDPMFNQEPVEVTEDWVDVFS